LNMLKSKNYWTVNAYLENIICLIEDPNF
jgi:hypothetical protein